MLKGKKIKRIRKYKLNSKLFFLTLSNLNLYANLKKSFVNCEFANFSKFKIKKLIFIFTFYVINNFNKKKYINNISLLNTK
jgi:hypothetical protein